MPAEKLRLGAWIVKQADGGRLPGLEWVNREDGTFRVPWKHASRQGWSVDRDAGVFREWAIHTGRYRKGTDRPDPRRWKANFRCALNALPDINEVPTEGIARGHNAFKVYKMNRRSDKKDGGHSKRHHKTSTTSASQTTIATSSSSREHAKKSDVEPTKSRPTREEKLKKAPYYPYPSKTFESRPFFGFWPTFHPWPAHLQDHDYMNTWYDPRPEMKDKGVMTHPGIKQEPLSPGDKMMPSCSQDLEQSKVSDVAKVIVKEEDDVPSDQEIIDLVDQMSDESNSTLDDLDDMVGNEEEGTDSTPTSPNRASLRLVLKTEGSSNYGNDYVQRCLPLTPDSTMEILKGIHTS